MTGFEEVPTETLLAVRENLLHGLDKVSASFEDGSFASPGLKGEAPPCQSGQTTLALLAGIDAVLADRGGCSGHFVA